MYEILQAANKPPSFSVTPVMTGTELNCLREMRIAGSSGRNGELRSESILGPNAIGYNPRL